MLESPSSAVKKCPICGQPADPAIKPFCSKRCADIDLHRWLSGVYAVPVKEKSDEDENGVPRAPSGETDE